MRGNWNRVTRHHKCQICGHDTWCLFNSEAVLCMRAVSSHEIRLKSGETGYIHKLTDGTSTMHWTPKLPKEPEPDIDWESMFRRWRTPKERLAGLSSMLGVSAVALEAVGCSWAPEHRAYAFPMYDGYGAIVGARLRSAHGKKWAVKGSHQGLFRQRTTPDYTIMVCEGPTDTAAAIDLGYCGIGRPSCSGGIDQLRTMINQLNVSRAIIVSDNDDPGLNGAAMVGRHLMIPFCIVVPPAKDLRCFVQNGGTRTLMESLLKGKVWQGTRSTIGYNREATASRSSTCSQPI